MFFFLSFSMRKKNTNLNFSNFYFIFLTEKKKTNKIIINLLLCVNKLSTRLSILCLSVN